MKFKELHYQNDPLLICNVWDVPSAIMAEKMGFKAIGTSSAAIAEIFGYQDGEEISFSELLYVVKKISANSHLPLTVDIESGYSRDPKAIAHHIKELAKLGVVGINIEDTVVTDHRDFITAEEFAKTLTLVKKELKDEGISMFINIRTDAFLLGVQNPVEETLQRIKIYEDVEIEGVFVPCIQDKEDIRKIVESTSLPINVMWMPALPNFNVLQELGVKRISMGGFLFQNVYSKMGEMLEQILQQQSFKLK
ncbi:isocitrate lyase/PEP mutase family protein [Aquimarina algicola]|uniref:Isocitrate lyase/phosphoenolpyruvate mutase family protein n=1 Tax=Aquimarina algicola TaxID=2589995 RepID=A0A504JQQ6_9FLAO|nr:isocitrate lyase/phosphoenolpyruvate mutase family protein [Aquimarina algicola]TPN88680.1 isocitrate lyase/phosphoenolpyruvate mutase family protein [Aquimarina algicola]